MQARFAVLLSLWAGHLLASSFHPFFQTPYQPNIALSLKGSSQRSLAHVGVLMPLYASYNHMCFSQIFGLWDNQSAKEGNIGLGYRHQLSDSIVGAYGFFDRRLSAYGNYHSQITFGLELLGSNIETRINGYIPTTSAHVTNAKVVNKAHQVSLVLVNRLEKSLGGFDIEVGGNLPTYQHLQGFLTYYHFNGSSIKAINGVRLRGHLHLTNYMTLMGETSYDRLRKSNWFTGLQLRISFGAPEQGTRLSQKMMQMIIRDIDVVTDSYTKCRDIIYKKQQPSYTTQKSSKDLLNKNCDFIEIREFIASPTIRDKIQNIVVYSPTDIRLKLKSLNNLDAIQSQFIIVPPCDAQGILPCKNLKNLACFVNHSYWCITSIGKDYRVKAYARGLGGGDREPKTKKIYLRRSVDEATESQSMCTSSSNQPYVPSEQGSEGTHIAYMGQGAMNLHHVYNSHVNQTTVVNNVTEPLFKPYELGNRPDSNPQFIARQSTTGEDVLTDLKDRFGKSSSPTIEVITGMGGLGKTQLAVEYIERTKGMYDGMFWIQANQLDYQLYIQALEINTKGITSGALAQTIHTKLMHKGYERVLWVYDDVPNATVFNDILFNNTIKSIWRQSKTKVDVLITSRCQSDWRQWEPIELELFTLINTQAYIDSFFINNQYPFPKPSREEIEQLNTLLGGLPLAVAQVLHYLKQQKNGTGLAQYINMYEENFDKKSWLDYSIQTLNGHEQTVWRTWDITRKSLSKDADLLLQMCCFLSNESIAKLLLEPLWGNKVDILVTELTNYSLITLHKDFNSFNIHVLLQHVLKLKQDKASVAFEQAYDLLEKAGRLFSQEDKNTWVMAKGWLVHITPMLQEADEELSKATIFFNYGLIADFFGDYVGAKAYLEKALTLQKHHYGEEHIELAATLNNLGNIELDLAPYEVAKGYYSEALAIKQKYYGEGHIALASTLGNLGHIERRLGYHKEAKDYYNQALTLQKNHYGEAHIELAGTLHNLGLIEADLGKYKTAKKYYNKALALQKRHYGKEHIKLADTLHNLGDVEADFGCYEKAKDCLEKALALKKCHYGEEHINLADTLHHLGHVEANLGRYEKAKDYLEKALALQKHHCSEEHIELANTLHNLGHEKYYYGEEDIELANMLIGLGDIEADLGCYEIAKDYLEKALVLQKNHYGEEHIKLAYTLVALGDVEVELGCYEAAKAYYIQVLALQKHHYGEEHIALADTLGALGNVEAELGHYEVAKDYYSQALALQKHHYGEEHIALADTLGALGNVEAELGHYEAAKKHYDQSLVLLSKHYGKDHIELAIILNNLGEVHQKLGHSKEAKNYAEKALKLQGSYYGEEHIERAYVYDLLGSIYLSKKSVKKSLTYYQKSLKIKENYYKQDHIEFVASLVGLGNIYLAHSNTNQALTYYQRALTIQELHYGSKHIKMLNTLTDLVKVYESLNKPEKVQAYLERIAEIKSSAPNS